MRFPCPRHCHVTQPSLLSLFTLKDLCAHPSSPCWEDGRAGGQDDSPERKAHSTNHPLVLSVWESLKVTQKLQRRSHQRDALKMKVLRVQGVLPLYPISASSLSQVCHCTELEWFRRVCVCAMVCAALSLCGETSSIDQQG